MNQTQARDAILARVNFTASALSGAAGKRYETGRLNIDERATYAAADIDYTVLSYGTPIAWHTADGWYIVGQKFSQTTSRHQSQVRRALTGEKIAA